MLTIRGAFSIGLLVGVLGACGAFGPPPTALPDGGFAGGAVAGGTASSGGGGTDAGLPWRTACTTLNARRCELLRTCGVIEDTTDAYRACFAWLTATWCGPTRWQSRVEVGTLRYDGVRALTCATDWTTRACSDWATEPLSCLRFVSPAVSLGGRCYDGFQECADSVCRGGGCPRVCGARGGIGEVCVTASDCQPNLYCRPPLTTGSSQCTAWGLEQAPCSPTQLCGPGLVCTSGGCRRLPQAEQACLLGRCDDSSFCVVGADGGQCELRRDAGVACTDDTQCGVGLVCETTRQQCVSAVAATVGGECAPPQQCPAGATCIVEAGQQVGTCLAPKRAGEACRAASDCQGHLTCLEADGGHQCGARKPNGAPCTTSRDCLALSACAGGACAALPVLGEACSAMKPCLWGACLDTNDAGAVCIEPQGAGQPCRTGGDCASGRCEQGLCTSACLP